MLAPHLVWPARNGADITLDQLGQRFSHKLPFVDIVGAREVARYQNGEITARRAFDTRLRSRSEAGLRTLLGRSHYYAAKFLTRGFRRVAREYLADARYRAVLYSYLTTALLARPNDPRPQLVWSHNDEFRWFQDLAAQAPSRLGQHVARASERWLHRFMARAGKRFVFLHVTQDDADGWEQHVPHHRYRVIPIGVALRQIAPPRAPDALPRLLFVGSLGVRMNLDALRHFATRYEPALRARFGEALRVDIAGSSPLPDVHRLCTDHGWALHADVEEAQLDALYGEATFSLLPFAYATGAKLKLLKSLAYGVPFLATTSVQAQADLAVPPSLIDDDRRGVGDEVGRDGGHRGACRNARTAPRAGRGAFVGTLGAAHPRNHPGDRCRYLLTCRSHLWSSCAVD